MHGDMIEQSLKKWLDENLPLFLTRINAELMDENPWEMPTIEDYVLVVAVKDYKDGLGGIFTLGDAHVPPYRIIGLLNEALNRNV